MSKKKLVFVAIALLFTIALVCVSFLDCKKVDGTSDQVVIEVNSESDRVNDEFKKLGKVIVEDKNPDYITWLSNYFVNDQVIMSNHNESDNDDLMKLKKVIVEDKNPDYITWLSTKLLTNKKETYI